MMNTPLRKQFGERVKELRLASAISQETFSGKCGFARSYMSRIERGLANPSLDTVEALADALGVKVGELFNSADTETSKPAAILVPFASDGSCFNPSLRCPKTGTYTVGENGKEISFDTFDSALEHIKMMYTPRWRRPNEAGNWEIVSAVKWELLPKKY